MSSLVDRSEVYDAIDDEREYQDSRWNSNTTESGGFTLLRNS